MSKIETHANCRSPKLWGNLKTKLYSGNAESPTTPKVFTLKLVENASRAHCGFFFFQPLSRLLLGPKWKVHFHNLSFADAGTFHSVSFCRDTLTRICGGICCAVVRGCRCGSGGATLVERSGCWRASLCFCAGDLSSCGLIGVVGGCEGRFRWNYKFNLTATALKSIG